MSEISKTNDDFSTSKYELNGVDITITTGSLAYYAIHTQYGSITFQSKEWETFMQLIKAYQEDSNE